MSESQQDCLRQIQQYLEDFHAGKKRLGDLVDDLPDLLKAVPDPDPMWREEFVGYWWTLEQIHSEAIDLGESRRMPTDTRRTVDEAIGALGRLTNEALSSASA